MSVVDRVYLPIPAYGDTLRSESQLRKYGKDVYLIARLNVAVNQSAGETGYLKAKSYQHYTVVDLSNHQIILRDFDLYAAAPDIETVRGTTEEELEYDPNGGRLVLIAKASKMRLLSVEVASGQLDTLFESDADSSCLPRTFAVLSRALIVATDGAAAAKCACYYLREGDQTAREFLSGDSVNNLRVSPDGRLLLLRAKRGFKLYSIK